jgi:hypothetical protein
MACVRPCFAYCRASCGQYQPSAQHRTRATGRVVLGPANMKTFRFEPDDQIPCDGSSPAANSAKDRGTSISLGKARDERDFEHCSHTPPVIEVRASCSTGPTTTEIRRAQQGVVLDFPAQHGLGCPDDGRILIGMPRPGSTLRTDSLEPFPRGRHDGTAGHGSGRAIDRR